jgi:hypothetical protein
MASDKQYINGVSLKMKEFPNGGQQMKFSISFEKFVDQIRPLVNEKGYVNLIISSRKEVGKYGDTHCLSVDTWKPEQKTDVPRSSNPASRYAPDNTTVPEQQANDSELPF